MLILSSVISTIGATVDLVLSVIFNITLKYAKIEFVKNENVPIDILNRAETKKIASFSS